MTVPTVPQVFPVVPLSAVGIGLLIGVIHYVGVCFTTYQFDCFVKGVNFIHVLHVVVDKGKLIHEFLRSYRVAVAVGACFSDVFALNTQTIQIGERGETVGVVCKEVTFHVAAFEILVGFACRQFSAVGRKDVSVHVYFVVVAVVAVFEPDVVRFDAEVSAQFTCYFHCRIRRNVCVGKRYIFNLLLRQFGCVCTRRVVVVERTFKGNKLSADCPYLGLVAAFAVHKFHFVHHYSVIEVQFVFLNPQTFGCGGESVHTQLVEGYCKGGVVADVGFFAGRTALAEVAVGYVEIAENNAQFVYRERNKLLFGVQRAFGCDIVNELRFSYGNSVLFCKSVYGIVGLNPLRKHGCGNLIVAEHYRYFVGNLLNDAVVHRFRRIHAYKHGIGQIGKIAVAKHGTDESVYYHVEIASTQIHGAENYFAVGVQRGYGNDLLFVVEFNFDAGVDVQRNRCRRSVFAVQSDASDHQHGNKHKCQSACGNFPHQVLRTFCPCRHRRILRRVAIFFYFVQNVGGGVGETAIDLFFNLFHKFSSDKIFFSFFMARLYFESTVERGSCKSLAISVWRNPDIACSTTTVRSWAESISRHFATTSLSSTDIFSLSANCFSNCSSVISHVCACKRNLE